MREINKPSVNDEQSDRTEDTDPTPEEVAAVERERDQLKDFVKGLNFDEVKSGAWFPKLLTLSLKTYTKKVDSAYFQEKYRGVPPDAIVDQRIKMAARYAAIEGGLSAGAYTGTLAATLGSAGAASPVTVPAAVTTVLVDVAYLSQLQIRLAYDIAVLYQVPLDTADPEDLWKLIRVAFTIKSGELVRGGVIKAVPALLRPLIKKFFSGPVLVAAKGLPVVGKFLLQRNLIKVGLPLVGIPLAIGLNRWTTIVVGKHARAVFRNEARIIEEAARLVERTRHPELLLWVAWIVINSDSKVSDDEALIMRYLVRTTHERYQTTDEKLAKVIEVDLAEVWARIEAQEGDLTDLVDAAISLAKVDGDVNEKERELIEELRIRCRREDL